MTQHLQKGKTILIWLEVWRGVMTGEVGWEPDYARCVTPGWGVVSEMIVNPVDLA